MSKPVLRQRQILWFFLPLLLNVQLMSVSHAIINGALARLEDFVTALAAFSVAMVLHLLVASPSYQNHTVTITMVQGRRSLGSVVLFVILVACYVSLMLGLLAFSPLGDFVLRDILGVGPAIAAGAREALSLLVLLPFLTGFRGLFQGLVIQARRPGLVSLATGVRVGALLALLALGSRWFGGPRLGAFALVGCILLETTVMGLCAWRVHLPLDGRETEEKGTGAILRYSFPLAYSSCLQQTIPLLINAVLGRLPDAPLALAAFGVIRAFLFLLAGPMRNLQQVYLTLAQTTADYRAVIRFCLSAGISLGLLVLLVAWPANDLILGRWMGIDASLRSYLTPALTFCAIYPLIYGGSNLLRGWFAGAHQTARLGQSTFYKMLFMLACLGLSLLLPPPPVSGILVGVLLLLAAELLEAGYLKGQRSKTRASVVEGS